MLHSRAQAQHGEKLIELAKADDLERLRTYLDCHNNDPHVLDAANDDGETALHYCAETGLFQFAYVLLSKGASVDPRNLRGRTPLHKAAKAGQLLMLTLLLDRDADIEAMEKEQHCRPLHFATKYGHKEVAKLLIERGAQIDVEKSDGWKPLHLASKFGFYEIAALLLEAGTPVDTQSTQLPSWTPLHVAAREGHDEVVLLLLDKRAEIDMAVEDGCTPLHLASWNGHETVVTLLLSRKAKVDVIDKNGATALHFASYNGHEKVVSHLLEQNAAVNVAKQGGWTPLHLAAKNDHVGVATVLLDRDQKAIDTDKENGSSPLHVAAENGCDRMVSLLLRKGACADSLGPYKSTPLHCACQNGRETVASILLKNGASVNAAKTDGQTPLHVACRGGHEEVVSLLLSTADTDVDREDEQGCTPLWVAVRHGHEEIAKKLLEKDANVEGSENAPRGRTILFVACEHDHVGIAALLLDNDANLEATSTSGGTPLYYSVWEGRDNIVALLRQRNADFSSLKRFEETELHVAALLGRLDKVQSLLEGGANIEAVNANGSTPLTAAVCACKYEVAAYLLDRGANIEATNSAYCCKGYRLLHHVARRGRLKMVSLLVSHRANVKARNHKGRTPLFLAAQEGHTEVADHLLKNHADANAEDKDGCTPLWVASQEGRGAIVSLLLSNGADFEAKLRTNGRTPLFAACEKGHVDVASLLLSGGAEVNVRDKDDRTPLYFAASGGHHALVSTLLDNGADPMAAARDGKTPLGAAVYLGHANIVRLLHFRGAKVLNSISRLHLACALGNFQMLHQEVTGDGEGEIDVLDENRWTPLDFAAADGRVEFVDLLLRAGANIHGLDPKGFTPLHTAAWWGNDQVARLLLEWHADIGARDQKGETPLHVASQNGHSAVVQVLLDYGDCGETPLHTTSKAGVDARNYCGETPLHMASRTGETTTASLLVDGGAKVDASSKDGITSLFIAAYQGHETLVKLFLDADAVVDYAPRGGATPLHAAASQGRYGTVSLLLSRGANAELLDKQGKTAFYLAAENGHKAVLELLSSSRKSQSQKSLSQKSQSVLNLTELHLASIFGDLSAANEFITSQPFDLETAMEDKWTALHMACRFGNLDIAELLIRCGATLKTKLPFTPLHAAAFHGQEDVIDALLKLGPNHILVSAKDYEGKTPLHFAAEQNHVAVVSLLVQDCRTEIDAVDCNGLTALSLAAKAGHDCVVQVLLANDAGTDVADKDGRTPLWWASLNGWNRVVSHLLQEGKADVEAQRITNGCGVLYVACEGGYYNVASQLLEHGANPNGRNEDSCAPLCVAARKDFLAIAKLLLDKGAQPDILGRRGVTPLHRSAANGHVEMVRLLLDWRAEVDVLSSQKETALYMAAKEGHDRVVSLLWRKGARLMSGLTELHVRCSLGDREFVQALVTEAEDTDLRTEDGWTPVGLACVAGHEEIVELLVGEHRASQAPGKTNTPLHFACTKGNVGMVSRVLKSGVYLDALDHTEATPLSVAAKHGHAEVVSFLLDRGANKEAENALGETPLYVAAALGKARVVSTLLERGAVPSKRKNNGATPLHAAVWFGHDEVVRLLLDQKTVNSPMTGMWKGQVEDPQMENKNPRVPKTADPTLLSPKYRPIHLAALSGRTDLVRLLLNNGAKVDGTANKSITALHIAVKGGFVAVAQLLLENGADTTKTCGEDLQSSPSRESWSPRALKEEQEASSAPDSQYADQGELTHSTELVKLPTSATLRSTAVHLASRNGDVDMVRLLHGFKADLEAKDSKGRTPLRCAVEAGHAAVVDFLSKHVKRCSDNIGWLRRSAERKGYEDVVKVLENSTLQGYPGSSSEPETENETMTTTSEPCMEEDTLDNLLSGDGLLPSPDEAVPSNSSIDVDEISCPATPPLEAELLNRATSRGLDAGKDDEKLCRTAAKNYDARASEDREEMEISNNVALPKDGGAHPRNESNDMDIVEGRASVAKEHSSNLNLSKSGNATVPRGEEDGIGSEESLTEDEQQADGKSTSPDAGVLEDKRPSEETVRAIRLVQINGLSTLDEMRKQRIELGREIRRNRFPRKILQTMLCALIALDVELKSATGCENVKDELMRQRGDLYKNIAAALKQRRNTPEQDEMQSEFDALCERLDYLANTTIGMKGAEDAVVRGPSDIEMWSPVDRLLTRAQRKRENDSELKIPRGACLAYVIGVFMEMRKLNASPESFEYANVLYKILQDSKEIEETRAKMIDYGVSMVTESVSELERTELCQVLETMTERKKVHTMNTELFSTGNSLISLRNLQALAAHHNFPVVLIHAEQHCRRQMHPRKIEVVYPDDRLVSTISSLRDVHFRNDEALWLVLTKETSDASLLHANAAFRWPRALWRDLSGFPVNERFNSSEEEKRSTAMDLSWKRAPMLKNDDCLAEIAIDSHSDKAIWTVSTGATSVSEPLSQLLETVAILQGRIRDATFAAALQVVNELEEWNSVAIDDQVDSGASSDEVSRKRTRGGDSGDNMQCDYWGPSRLGCHVRYGGATLGMSVPHNRYKRVKVGGFHPEVVPLTAFG